MKLSIRSRLIVSFAGVIALVLVCQLAFNLFFATGYYLRYQEKRMYSAFDQIQTSFNGTVESIESAASAYENMNNIEVVVWVDELVWYTSYDRLVYGSSNHQANGGMSFALPDITGQVQQAQQETLLMMPQGVQAEGGQGGNAQQEGAGMQQESAAKPQAGDGVSQEGMGAPQESTTVPQEGDAVYQEAQTGTEVLHLVDAFEYQGQTITVALTLSIDSIESSAEVFSNSSMVISLVALIIGLLYSLVLSKSITKPILEIEQIAGEFANLDFSRKAKETASSTELYRLSKSVNSMSDQLEKSIVALNEANEKLQNDIDYQKQMEQMRREFMGNVSHEMKTPLTMLQIYAESLKDNLESVDKDYYCDTIMEETETLNDLVASMLDISSIESGLSKMQMEELDISIMLSALVARLQPMLAKFEVSCMIEPDITLLGDEKYLEQATKNYITNAMEHTVEGGKISISLTRENGEIVYRVQNQGKQIAEDEMPRLWDSFYRADKARSRVNKNVGLGLHIVKTVVEKHAGRCQCENTMDGVRFSFYLPEQVFSTEATEAL